MTHALQLNYGFPIIIKNLTKDKRFDVIRELNSNLLHINLVNELKKRELPIKEYIKPTIDKLIKFIKDHKNIQKFRNLSYERTHYDAIVLLRLEYEAIHITLRDKEIVYKKYKEYLPEVYSLFLKVKNIILKYDMNNPEDVTTCLKCIINLLNNDLDYSIYLSK